MRFRHIAKRACGEVSRDTNLRFLPMNRLLERARAWQQVARGYSWKNFQLCAKLAAARASRGTWQQKAKSAGGRGEVKRMTDELVKAFEDGKFEKKRALFHFLQDMIHSVAAEPNKRGHRAKIHWHGATHKLFMMLRKLGGPRTQRFVTVNLGGPDEETTRRRWNKAKFVHYPGVREDTFTRLEKLYKNVMTSRDMNLGSVLCEASEDETNILAEIRWNAKRDCVTGT